MDYAERRRFWKKLSLEQQTGIDLDMSILYDAPGDLWPHVPHVRQRVILLAVCRLARKKRRNSRRSFTACLKDACEELGASFTAIDRQLRRDRDRLDGIRSDKLSEGAQKAA